MARRARRASTLRREGRSQERQRGPRPADEAPRVRDLPAPRRPQSVVGPLFHRVFAWPYRVLLAGFYRSGLRPWQLTLLSLAANIAVAWLLVRGDRVLPGIVLVLAGLFDVFDGAVARLRGEAGPSGAFLDSVFDRVSDIVVLGALFWSEIGQGRRVTAAFALTTLIVTLLVSYLRAEAESMGVTLSAGLVQRLERYVALTVGFIVPGTLLPVLVLLAGLGGLTAAQRAVTAWRRLAEPDPGPAGRPAA